MLKYILMIYGCLVLAACSKIDDFRKFETGRPIVYTSRPDSLSVLPGKNRVGIAAILNDPKVVLVRVFWSNHADSVEFPVQVVPGMRDTFFVSGLPEGVASFDVRTYDKDGHASIPSNITGNVYGSNYAKGLLNRGISVVNYSSAHSLDITWSTPDTINTLTKLYYTSVDGDDVALTVDPLAVHTVIIDYDPSYPSYYRSFYKPVSNAVDTFGVAVGDSLSKAKGDITLAYLKNASFPLAPTPESGTDRFRNLADWITTPNVFNAPGGVGGWVSDNNTCISMEVGWGGKSPIEDGKIYQTITLQAGLYSFITSPLPRKDGLGSCTIYVVVAEGSGMPNTGDVPSQALAYRNLYDEQPVNFSLSAPTTISIGFVATMPSGNYLQWSVNVLQLLKL